MRELIVVFAYSGQRRRSRRRGPDGQEMRNMSKQQMVEVAGPHWSDDESDMPPSKRARDTGYASDHTVVTEYEDMWGQARAPHAILTPPSMVSTTLDFLILTKIFLSFLCFNTYILSEIKY